MRLCEEGAISRGELELKYLDVRCPFCKAEAGENCRSVRAHSGEDRELRHPHLVRVYASVSPRKGT